MTQNKTITKTRVGKHLSFEEKIQIQTLKAEGYSNREISKRLNRAPQTINNEIKLGTVTQWMNDPPRKILNYLTPHEAFINEIKEIGLTF